MILRPRGMLLLLIALILLGSQSGWESQRDRMVRDQIAGRGISNKRVLEAMRSVPRHEFIPESHRAFAYHDSPIPIGQEQTISQPYIVAFMTEQLDLQPEHRLFELGTGSGYQAAVASLLVKEVFTVEIVPLHATRARQILADLGYNNVHVHAGDGWAGWPEAAPFDRIIVTAAAPELPQPLLDQLRPGGMLIMPLGAEDEVQSLVRVEKTRNGELRVEELLPVRFVPVTGDH